MIINIDKSDRTEAVASLQRYLQREFDDSIGSLQADALLHYFLEEIGPLIYNDAIRQAQERLQARIAELDIDGLTPRSARGTNKTSGAEPVACQSAKRSVASISLSRMPGSLYA